ncbi:inverse autotransporter beta domain-containing protein [Serratia fonticola]|uniref:inverse autotransporter beta domain-containing protein n=1 Tax=Serratia fonticola TaxID=47917 RepID=UPI00093E9814|nr:inverse autotransporter beta domain-containing protein [Serratia fonticola]OKP23811.1 murein transglycosylase [Serratia fonticola]
MITPFRLSVIASLLMGSGMVLAAGGGGASQLLTPPRAYTVPADSSLYQLALQSGVSVSELRKLNKGSLDRRDTVKKGESLMLPASSPLFPTEDTRGVIASDLPELGMGNAPLPKEAANATEVKTAGTAQFVAGQDWNNMTSDQVKNQAESWAKNKAKSQVVAPVQKEVQDFLGKFGKAQVNIAVDDKGSLKGSGGSLFSPWYETDSLVAFTQVGIHGQDDRLIGNVGAGVRHDQGDWLLGYNVFIDQDISRSHTRGGVGAELWRDNLKLGANYYHPLSSWKDSKDFDDYLERPAKGFDVRAQGYLPAYPQLGASMVYEQYFGDEVALFGKDNLQSNPHAVTVGVDYTPVPLLTLKLSHKAGQNGKSEQKADLQLSYQIGTPLDKQLDPDRVAQARSLKGSRYDLVDRNYDIVLEYKEKQGVFDLDLAAVPATLLEGDEYVMQPLVHSKYRITAVNWNGDVIPLSMVATAGTDNPQGWQITLPAWDSAPDATNIYHLSITLTDEKGRQVTSNTVEVRVGQQRQGKLDVENGASKPATGLATDAVQLVTYLTNHEAQAITDPALTPTWIVKDAVTGKAITVSASCSTDAQGKAEPCVSLKGDRTEERDGVTYYVRELVSTLPGRYQVVADLGTYGMTAPQEVTFSVNQTTPDVARAEILDPDGKDILAAQLSPQVGVTYTVKLFDAAGEDVTASFPPETLHWALDGNAAAAGEACNVTLTEHDTGVTGYTFTPRTNANSNSGVVCGDQGFGLKVLY